MATVLRTPPFRPPRLALPNISFRAPKPLCLSFGQVPTISNTSCLRLSHRKPLRFVSFVSEGEAETPTEPEPAETLEEEEKEEGQQPEIVDAADDVVAEEDGSNEDEVDNVEEVPLSPILASLQSYKEALASEDACKVAEIEVFMKSIEDEKINLELKVATLTEELSAERERVLRIGADFDNFRKRTDRERLSLVTNAQGELVENLLPVLDNFERAKSQIKIGTEAEEKINNSYQSIYKQFMEILTSLGVVPVEPKGNPFDPLLHEAIMREESTEFEEGIIVEEYRKGFKLGDRLLRPSMVKVSAGPGPEKLVEEPSAEETVSANVTSEEGSVEAEST